MSDSTPATAASIPYEGTDCTPEEAVEAVKAVRATAARRFVQTDSPTPGDGYFCTCGSTDGDCLRCYLASWHYKRACTVGAT